MSATTQLGKVSVTPQGAWSSATAYAILDIVTNGGGSYLAKKAVPAGTALSNTEYWLQITEKGSKGDTGDVSADVIADAYSASSTYAVGDYCFYDGNLYRCNTAITTAEAWTAAHWTEVSVADEISVVNDDLANELPPLMASIVPINSVVLDAESYWEVGGWYTRGGTTAQSTNQLRTKTNVSNVSYVSVSDGYEFLVAGFKYDGTYLGVWDGTDFIVSDTKRFSSLNFDQMYAKNGYYFRIVARRKTLEDVSVSEYTNISVLTSSSKVIDLFRAEYDTEVASLETNKVSFNRAVYGSAKRITSSSDVVAPYDDCDTLPSGSIVTYIGGGSTVSNMPDASFKNGTIVTFDYSNTETDNVQCQLAIKKDGTIYARHKWSSWSAWKTPVYQSNETDVSVFQNIGIIGDSFSSGGLKNSSGSISNNYAVSWGQIMARRNGVTVTNYSSTGASISRFLSNSSSYSSWSITKLEEDSAKDLYIIVLGINKEPSIDDPAGSGAKVDTGTTADINDSDYTQNADTFCGHYGQMVARIKIHAPNAKIIFVVPVTVTGEKATAIASISEHYSIPYFNMNNDAFYSTSFYTNNQEVGHPTVIAYAGMEKAFERQIAQCMVDNSSYFNTYRPQ